MPLPVLPPIDTEDYARYRTTQLRRASSRELVERARAIPPPAYRGPPEIAPPAPVAPAAQGAPAAASQPQPVAPVASQDPRKALIETAQKEIGKRYAGPVIGEPDKLRWGDPGWDCSSFVSGVYKQFGIDLTPYTDAIAGQTTKVATEEAQPGDILLYRYADPSQRGVTYPHTGIYLGNGQMIDASTSAVGGGGVQIRPLLNKPYEIRRPAGMDEKLAAAVPAAALQTAQTETTTPAPPVAPSGGRYPIAGQPTAAPAGPVDLSSRQAFAQTAGPYAKQIEAETGIPAGIMMGIAINEGALAKGTVASQYNNLFGIKATRDWQGPTTPTMGAWEVIGGKNVTQPATFRAYESPAESFRDFAAFLQQNPRYGEALKHTADPNRFITELKKAGYATDPAWPQKVLNIAGHLPDLGPAVAAPVPTSPEVATATMPPPAAPPRTYASPADQLADLAARYGGGAPAADFAAGAEAQLADLGRRYGLPAMAPTRATTPAAPFPAVPDYQAIAGAQLAQTAQNRAARAYVPPVPEPEPVYEPEPLIPEPEELIEGIPRSRLESWDQPTAVTGPPPGFGAPALTGDADRGIGLGPPPPEPLPPPVESLAPVPEPVPLPPPLPVPEPTWAEQRQEAFAPPAAPLPPAPVAPAPEPANPFERVGRALVDALKGVPDLAGQAAGAVAQIPAGVAGVVGEQARQTQEMHQQIAADLATKPREEILAEEIARSSGPTGNFQGSFGPTMEERAPAIAAALETPVAPGLAMLPGGAALSAAATKAGEIAAGRPPTYRDIYGLAGGDTAGAGFQLPFGVGGRTARAIQAAERGVIPAAEGVIPAAERVAEAARPVGRLTVEEASERLAAAAPVEAPPLPRPGGGLPDEVAAAAPQIIRPLAAGAPALPPRIPPAGVAAGESAGREFAGNIRLGKYTADVQPIIAAAYDETPDVFEAARRGVVTDADVRALASLAKVDVDQVVKRWKPGTAANGETIQVLRETLAAQKGKVAAAQQTARASDSSDNVLRLTEELTKYRALQEAVHGVTAEAGRALRVFRQPVAGEGGDIMLARVLKLTSTEDLSAARDLLLGTDLSDPTAVASLARALYQPTTWEKTRAYWINSLLSGPPGRIRDFVSSAYSLGTAPLERGVAVPIDIGITAGRRAAQALRGKPVTAERAIYASEIPAEYVGMAGAFRDSFRDSMHMIRHGFTPGQVARGDIEAIAKREVIPGAFNLPGRLVGANDVFFKGLSSGASIRAQAVNQAKAAGLAGDAFATRVEDLVRAPTDAMLTEAENVAKYRAFQAPSDLAKRFAHFKNTPGPIGQVATAVMPFHSTAIALAKWAMERSPVGLAMLGLDAKAGRLTQKGLAEGLARVGIGSALLYEGWQLAQDDLLTGAAPKDAAERDAFYRQGKAPYSIKLGGNWVSYQGAPFAPILASAVAARDAVRAGDSDTAAAIWATAALGAGQAMLDQPFLTGIQQLAEALNDPTRFGANYAESWGRAAVPQVLQTVARATDNIIRDPDGPIEAALAGIPGVSQTLPARLGAFGEPATRPESQLGLQVLNPLRPTPAKTDPVEQELVRLQLKDWRVEPGFVGKKIAAGPGEVELTPDERRRYQAAAGKLTYGILTQILTSPGWGEIPDSEKYKIIHSVYADARKAARAQLMGPELIERGVQEYRGRQERSA